MSDLHERRIDALWELFRKGEIDRALSETQAIGSDDPAWGRARLLEGNLRLARRELDLARLAFEAALTVRPNDPDAWNNLGNVHAVAEERERARACFERALAIDAAHRDATLNLGTLASLSGAPEEAERRFRAAIAIDRESPLARRSLAALLASLGRLDEAESELGELIALAPRDPEALSTWARFLGERGKFPEAAVALEALLAVDPSLGWARGALAECLLRLDRPAEALGHLERALEAEPRSPLLLTNYGVAAVGVGNSAAARGAFASALELDAAFFPASLNLARLALTAGDVEGAVVVVRAAIRAGSGRREPREYLVSLLLRVGRAAEAVEAARSFAVELPEEPEIHNLLGVALQSTGQLEEAARAYRRAIELMPRSQGSWLNLAQCQLQMRDAAAAESTLSRALGEFPESTYVRALLGRSLEARGASAEARVAYEQAVASDVRNLMAWDALAGLARAANDTRLMIDVYRRAVKANPGFDRRAFANLGAIDLD